MATLATVLDKIFESGVNKAAEAVPAAPANAPVRPFANEDIYFYVKRIDNSRVVRAADPQARQDCWKLIGSVVAAAALLIGVLLPSAYSLVAGREIQTLRQEAVRLENERASLELDEAKLLSPARMEELARIQQFVDPAPQKVVYLDAEPDVHVAQNASRDKGVSSRPEGSGK